MISKEKQKAEKAEEIWMHYYNQTLYEAGLITETQRNRMAHLINARALSTADRLRDPK